MVLVWPFLPAAAGNGRTGQITGAVWLNGKKQPVSNAVVYLGGVRPAPRTNAPPAVLDQQQNEFVPRVQLARGGTPLIIQNSDPHLHVLRVELLQGGAAARPLWRIATPYAGYEQRWTLPAMDEAFLLRACGENGHERMIAYVAVMPHPWAALTDAQGRYQIADVPVGEHRLYAWHETLGTLAGRVRVARGRASEVHFDFPHAP